MNLEDIMLRGIRQSKTNTVQFYIYELSNIVKFVETESRMLISRCRREGGKKRCCLICIKIHNCKMKKFWGIFFTTHKYI